jgi:hypothetical protein
MAEKVDLRLYAQSISRAVKIPPRAALRRLEKIWEDPELLGILEQMIDTLGPDVIVTNVIRVAPGEVEVSACASSRAREKGHEPKTVSGKLELVRHRIDDWRKHADGTRSLRQRVAVLEATSARRSPIIATALGQANLESFVAPRGSDGVEQKK